MAYDPNFRNSLAQITKVESLNGTPASIGAISLAFADLIAFRDNENTGDLTIGVDSVNITDNILLNTGATLQGLGTTLLVSDTSPINVSGQPKLILGDSLQQQITFGFDYRHDKAMRFGFAGGD